jgi:hypothetical protein
MDYTFLNKLLSKNFTRFFPKTINRKLFRKYNIFFVPTNLNTLPKSFYPIATNLKKQNDLIFKYRKNKKLINQTTKKKLDKFLFNYFGKSNFSFFDIGGENIDLYLHLSKKLNIRNYYLYNFKSLIILFKKLKKIFKFNQFFPTENVSSVKKIDFAYFGSCIQYFKNYKIFLKSIIKKKPKYIFFSGTSFFHDKLIKDYIVVKQTNYLPNTIYLFFFNLNNFIKFMNLNGYKLVFFNTNKTAKVNYKNFSHLLKKTEYLDILFKKK